MIYAKFYIVKFDINHDFTVKYGQMIDFGVGVASPTAMRLGIWSAVFALAHAVLISMGYDHYIEEAVNPITAGILQKYYKKYGHNFYLSYSMFDYKHMVIQELRALVKTVNAKQVKYLEDNAKICIYIDDYKLLRQTHNFKHIKDWFMFVADALNPSKL